MDGAVVQLNVAPKEVLSLDEVLRGKPVLKITKVPQVAKIT